MPVPFHLVIHETEAALAALRVKGLAGNIVRDRPEQMENRDHATWTGPQHQLALVGDPKDYHMELRAFEHGMRKPVQVETNSDKFQELVRNFMVMEG